MKKNNIKAVLYVVVGIVVAFAAILGVVAMYLSGTFLPVYIGTNFIIGNKILRYALYIILGAIIILSVVVADYGASFLIKKFHKRVKGR